MHFLFRLLSLKQEHALSAFLFNFALEYAIMNVETNMKL
jgi:hypothetical protein